MQTTTALCTPCPAAGGPRWQHWPCDTALAAAACTAGQGGAAAAVGSAGANAAAAAAASRPTLQRGVTASLEPCTEPHGSGPLGRLALREQGSWGPRWGAWVGHAAVRLGAATVCGPPWHVCGLPPAAGGGWGRALLVPGSSAQGAPGGPPRRGGKARRAGRTWTGGAARRQPHGCVAAGRAALGRAQGAAGVCRGIPPALWGVSRPQPALRLDGDAANAATVAPMQDVRPEMQRAQRAPISALPGFATRICVIRRRSQICLFLSKTCIIYSERADVR